MWGHAIPVWIPGALHVLLLPLCRHREQCGHMGGESHKLKSPAEGKRVFSAHTECEGQGGDAECNAFVMLLRMLLSITGVPGRHVRITGRCSRSRSLLSGIACLWQGSPQAADWFSRQMVTPFWKQDCVLGCPGDPNCFYRPGMEEAARREAGGGLEGLLPNFPATKNTVMPV